MILYKVLNFLSNQFLKKNHIFCVNDIWMTKIAFEYKIMEFRRKKLQCNQILILTQSETLK